MKKQVLVIIGTLVMFWGLSLVGCGSDDDDKEEAADKTGNCVRVAKPASTEYKICQSFENFKQSDLNGAKSDCEEANKDSTTTTWTDGAACSTDGALGHCAISGGGSTYKQYYYSDGFTAETASSGCSEAGGTWTAL